MISFEVGDVVRVRAARRRDVTYRLTEVAPTIVVAVSDRGEARYSPDAFELLARAGASPPSISLSVQAAPTPPATPTFDRVCDGPIYPLPGESIDAVWRRFKKSCEKADVFGQHRRHREFTSKSSRRRNKSHNARIRRMRQLRKGA